MFIWNISLEMTDTITSQNIDLFFWVTLYLYIHFLMLLFFSEIFRLAVIAVHETSVLLVTWLSLWYFRTWITDWKVSAVCSLPLSLFGMCCICVGSVCCVHNNEKYLSHWSFVGLLAIVLSSPCKVTCHSKTVRCSATVLSTDTSCVYIDLLIIH